MEELVTFCSKFGLKRKELASADTHLSFRLVQDVKLVERLSSEDFEAITRMFGRSVVITLANSSVEHVRVERGELAGDLAEKIEYLNENRDLEVTLSISIDKSDLLRRYISGGRSVNKYLFLFEDALKKYLDDSVIAFDNHFFQGTDQKTLIVLPNLTDSFISPFLLITGLENLSIQLQNFEQVENDDERQNALRSLSGTAVRWEGIALKHITPTHFMSVGTTNLPWLYEAMNKLLLYTSLMFTANRTTLNSNELEFNFYGLEQTRTVRAPLKPRSTDLVPGIAAMAMQVRELVCWVTDGSVADRLTIFQKVVTRELAKIESGTSLVQFVKQLPDILEKTRWNYNLFIDGRIDRHFEEVKAASSYFASVAQSIAQKVDTMTKSTSEAFLGAVGVVVISLLASYINQNISGVVFNIIVTVYGLFIVFVQMGYRMTAIWSEVWVLNQDFEDQETIYKNILTEKTVCDLTKQVFRRKRQFRIWFWITMFYYTAIVVALNLASQLTPLMFLSR